MRPTIATGPAAKEDTAAMNEPAPQQPPELALEEGLLPWEARLRQVLATTRSPRDQARLLLALLPSLPPEAITSATEQALQRVRDADYNAVVLPTLENPQTHGAAMSALFADLLERPREISVPALRTIAADPAHPFAASAREDLEVLARRAR